MGDMIMGLFDSFGDSSLTPEEKQAAKEAKAAEKQARKEAKEALTARITYQQPIKFIAGKELVNSNGLFGDKMYQFDDKTVAFNLDDPIFFTISSIEFAGPRYHEEVTTEGNAHTDSSSKTKKKGHGLIGGVLGMAVGGPIGLAAGAAAGGLTGRKSKTNGTSNTATNEVQRTTQIEDPSSTTFTLNPISQDEPIQIVVETLEADYLKLNGFKTIPIEKPEADINAEGATDVPAEASDSAPATETTADPIDELRKYKGLLDDGIITQEDFDAKKKQLLGL